MSADRADLKINTGQHSNTRLIMFTGIIQAIGKIAAIEHRAGIAV